MLLELWGHLLLVENKSLTSGGLAEQLERFTPAAWAPTALVLGGADRRIPHWPRHAGAFARAEAVIHEDFVSISDVARQQHDETALASLAGFEAVAAVRWTLSEPLEAGASAFNSYRVRLN